MPTEVCFAASREGKVYIRVEEDADTVGKRLRDNSDGWERFEVKGKPVFINVRNVLWVEERAKGKVTSF